MQNLFYNGTNDISDMLNIISRFFFGQNLRNALVYVYLSVILFVRTTNQIYQRHIVVGRSLTKCQQRANKVVLFLLKIVARVQFLLFFDRLMENMWTSC